MPDAAFRNRPSLAIEDNHAAPVCGIDEAGRGPLAGPVVAACVFLTPQARQSNLVTQIHDSKKLSAARRSVLFEFICRDAAFGIGKASPEEIDTLNIHHATLLAMRRAWFQMKQNFDVRPLTALIDGKFAPELTGCTCQTIIKGDSLSLSIAAASIIAKVTRDRIMEELDATHPAYGWTRNAGYGTPEHLEALKKHGPTPYHRRSFAPVSQIPLI